MRCNFPYIPDAVRSCKVARVPGQILFLSALILAALFNSGCGAASAGTSVVTPASSAVGAGGSVQFKVQTTPPIEVMSWRVSEIVGGSSTSGTISATGLYQAPKTVSSSQTVMITAMSAYGILGTASLRLMATQTASITPSSVTLASKQTTQFSITGGASNIGVQWSAKLGSISSSGLYTAPAVTTQSEDTVTATNSAGSQLSAAHVTVTPPSQQPVSVSVSPNSTTVLSGKTAQFSAVVSGTSNTSVTWTAYLGSISSSGVYSAPGVTVQSQDTVTAVSVADGSKSSSASITITIPVQGSGTPYSLKNPPSVISEFYPGTIFTTPLPSNVADFCLGQVKCGSSSDISNGLAIVSNSFGGNIANAAIMGITTSPTVQAGVDGHTLYYTSASDPVYEFIGMAGVHVPVSSGKNPVGVFFHITNQAQFSAESSDEFLNVWDQSSDIDSTAGGRILSVYRFNDGTPVTQSIPACTCTTTSCASTTATCQINIGEYAEYDYPSEDHTGYDVSAGAYASSHFAPLAAITRQLEWSSATINHAILLNANCMNPKTPTVFPSFGETGTCTDGSSLHYSNGSLLWIDTGYNCSTLPAWQKPFCVAMQTYGGYVVDSGGTGATGGVYPTRIENGVAWTVAGLPQPAPIFTYLSGAGTTNGLSCSGSPVNKCTFPVFNMPGLLGHLHVIDSCIPEAMTGQPGGCS